jgi:hypothetical protein
VGYSQVAVAAMAKLLPRFEPESDDPLEQLLAESEAREERMRLEVAAGVTASGDWARLRGLPAIGRGVSGAIPGTRPEIALLANDARRRFRRPGGPPLAVSRR